MRYQGDTGPATNSEPLYTYLMISRLFLKSFCFLYRYRLQAVE